ncbi:hypothetical protein ABKW02_23285 (plasmid) [Enterobacter cloacae]|uniref:hypothetical protein n=1 Tax=Enterobacter cloacae TaxID=550 RepID=UPI0032AF21E9
MGSCAAPSAKGDDKFITTDYLQQCQENTDGREIKAAAGVRSELEGADKASGEQSRASRVIADLANAERDMLRAAENTERGRTPEREEQTLTRTIQKER